MVVNRSPGGDPLIFLDKLKDPLLFLSLPKFQKFNTVIGGDFDSNFDVIETKQSVAEF